jgi:hypothetical protein
MLEMNAKTPSRQAENAKKTQQEYHVSLFLFRPPRFGDLAFNHFVRSSSRELIR